MTRDDKIEAMVKFLKSVPSIASDYHRVDMLLSFMERKGLGPNTEGKLKSMGTKCDRCNNPIDPGPFTGSLYIGWPGGEELLCEECWDKEKNNGHE